VTSDDIKRFETLLDLFGHPGWALLLDELRFKTESIKEQFTVLGIDPSVLAYGQGRISVYRELEGLGPVIRAALEENVEETAV
jgi:hypothetical protein